jgi:hypothetical protein
MIHAVTFNSSESFEREIPQESGNFRVLALWRRPLSTPSQHLARFTSPTFQRSPTLVMIELIRVERLRKAELGALMLMKAAVSAGGSVAAVQRRFGFVPEIERCQRPLQ